MDQELKQRLIGAAVVTALAAIFIPMLFDDPIDNSGQVVSELAIPQMPPNSAEDVASKLPASAEQVASRPDQEPLSPEIPESGFEPPLEAAESGEQPVTAEEEFIPPAEENIVAEESEPPFAETGNLSADGRQLAPKSLVANDKQVAAKKLPDKPAANKTVAESPTKTVKPPATESVAAIKPLPAATATAPKKTATGLVRWYVQAGSFGKKENALSQWETLRKQGLPVLLETQMTEKGTFYRLKVGPELDKKRARDIQDRLKKQNIKTLLFAE